MKDRIRPEDISIRTELRPGDIGFITYLHGSLYHKEYGYGLSFEAYVAKGMAEFYEHFDSQRDGLWICEHGNTVVGFLVLMHRERNTAQLRFFFLLPEYRGMGLGKRLMELFFEHLRRQGYTGAYLWTTEEQREAAVLYKKYGFERTEEKTSVSFGKELLEQKYEFYGQKEPKGGVDG